MVVLFFGFSMKLMNLCVRVGFGLLCSSVSRLVEMVVFGWGKKILRCGFLVVLVSRLFM